MKYSVYIALISTVASKTPRAQTIITNLNHADRVARRAARHAEWEAQLDDTVAEEAAVVEDMEEEEMDDAMEAEAEVEEELAEMEDDLDDMAELEIPSGAEVEDAKTIVRGWADRADAIGQEIEPIAQERNTRVEEAFNYHQDVEQRTNERLIDDLVDAQADFEEEVQEANDDLEEDLTNNGVIADVEALEDRIQSEMEDFEQNMVTIRRSSKALRSRRATRIQNLTGRSGSGSGGSGRSINTETAIEEVNAAEDDAADEMADMAEAEAEWEEDMADMEAPEMDIEDEVPTAEEIDAAKAIVEDWIARGEEISDRATPAVETRDAAIENAWRQKDERDARVWNNGIEDLVDAQEDFEDEVLDAQARLEETLEYDGTMADWEALQEQVENDVEMMENMSRRVRRMQWRSEVHRRASARLATNLYQTSEEMARNEPNPEEYDAIKTTVIGWVDEYERILEEAQPAVDRRDEDVQDAFEDREEEAEQTVERMLEDFEENDQMFDETVTEAQASMENELEENGVVADAEDLAEEIDATLAEVEQSMMRQRRNARSLRRLRAARNVQSLGEVADEMTEELPTGAEVHAQWQEDYDRQVAFEDMVNGWEETGMDIHERAERSIRRQQEDQQDAVEDRAEEMRESFERSMEDWEENDEVFEDEVQDAQHDAHDQAVAAGIPEDMEALGNDIGAQFEAWGSMRRVAPVQSLSRQDKRSVQRLLSKLERQIDGVLATI